MEWFDSPYIWRRNRIDEPKESKESIETTGDDAREVAESSGTRTS
ncbi:hypothetical protein ACERIT_03110 [Halopenitus sp. H-Gu1]